MIYMPLTKKALRYSLITGVAALVLIYVFSTLWGSLAAKDSSMPDSLYESGDHSFDQYRGGHDIFILILFTSVVIFFSCGFIAGALARPGDTSVAEWMKAPLVAACVPALAVDVYLLIAWYNDVQLFHTTGMKDGRPFEPLVFPAIMLYLVMVSAFCVGISLGGGLLARAALKPKANSRGTESQ
jgi:hypothetical protein